jgi:hypothetical protein
MQDWRAFLVGVLTTLSVLVLLVGFAQITNAYSEALKIQIPILISILTLVIAVWTTRSQLNQKEMLEARNVESKQRVTRVLLAPILSEIIADQEKLGTAIVKYVSDGGGFLLDHSFLHSKINTDQTSTKLIEATQSIGSAIAYADGPTSIDLALLAKHLQVQCARMRPQTDIDCRYPLDLILIPIGSIHSRASRLLCYSRGELTEYKSRKLSSFYYQELLGRVMACNNTLINEVIGNINSVVNSSWFEDPLWPTPPN